MVHTHPERQSIGSRRLDFVRISPIDLFIGRRVEFFYVSLVFGQNLDLIDI